MSRKSRDIVQNYTAYIQVKGMSGRTLRRLPLLAHAAGLTEYGEELSFASWIDTMTEAMESEKRQQELAQTSHG
jgi:hypothetical protein